eukprot:jgi/Galph1/3847/GphlegSOOS_G2446.1
MMKAAVLKKFNQPLSVERVPIPKPGFGEVLMQVKASGVCHSDVDTWEGNRPIKPKLPVIPGHEGAGIVAEVGSGVDFLQNGDRIGVPWLYNACGRCEFCYKSIETVCPNQECTGYTKDGSFAEYCVVDAKYVGRLPENVEFTRIAPVLCAGVTVYKSLKETEARPGQWVAIVGVGGLGHLAIQYAKAMGMQVVAVDIDDSKLQLGKKCGADIIINSHRENPVDRIQKEIGGAHGVVVTAVSPQVFPQAIGMVRRAGTVALNALPPGDFPLDIFDVILRRVTVRGSIVGTRQDLQEALDFAGRGVGLPEVHIRKLEEVNDILSEMQQFKVVGRIVIDMDSK